ncbi:MAG: TolB family protein [Omnitrophica WOR_2 bacterium]
MVRLLFIWAILVFTTGCSQRIVDLDQNPLPAEAITPLSSKTAPDSSLKRSENLLPHALYYLNHFGLDKSQVWRIPAEGGEAKLLTPEEEKISNYDVNPHDGTLAYITGDRLVLQAPTGGKTRLIQNAANGVSTPLWSPDGQSLAFGLTGISLYQAKQNKVIPLLTNPAEGPASYLPYLWSPDGDKLLVIISLKEGTTLGVLSLDTQELVQLHLPSENKTNDLVCCEASWDADNQSIFIANPHPNSGHHTGLWRFNSRTGAGVNLVPMVSPDGTYNLAGWPHISSGGELSYFFRNSPQLPDSEGPMTMVGTGSLAGLVSLLREDSFWVKEVLWSAEGDLAVIVIPSPGSTGTAGGTIILARRDGSPVQPLAARGDHLRWGP